MRYSIGTIVSNWHQYDAMQKSFFEAGFNQNDCQYIAINNVNKNRFCMYSGGNIIINQSIGDYIILAHQDVLFIYDNKSVLDERIEELERIDKSWAVAGNAGECNGQWLVRISDRYGEDQKSCNNFPHIVNILDGNLLVINKKSLVSFSNDIFGFHYYGWDICLNADVKGLRSYVIDFHVSHLGKGTVDRDFYECKNAFEEKWKSAIRPRYLGAFEHDKMLLE